MYHHGHHGSGHFHEHHGVGDADDILHDPQSDDRWNPDDIQLTTVGIDIGSATSHLIFSRLHLRRLGKLLTSRFVVVSREVLSRSPVLLTPYKPDYTIDAEQLDAFIQRAFRDAGVTPSEIDTGAIILTGEAVKRTNAQAIAELFAGEAGRFVCATAGHNLEAIMAAHGSGAVDLSRDNGHDPILNVDIGGGTAKLALVQRGEVTETATINVGGRLIATDDVGRVTRIEPAARAVADAVGIDLRLGEVLSLNARQQIVDALVDDLFAAMKREPLSPVGAELMLTPALSNTSPIGSVTFSGGVSEFLAGATTEEFGDLGPALADAIRARVAANGLPMRVEVAPQGIRATVLGASQFTVQVSGDTISVSRPEVLPLRNLRVVFVPLAQDDEAGAAEVCHEIRQSFQRADLEEGAQTVALTTNWNGTPHYSALRNLAEGIQQGMANTIAKGLPLVLVFTSDVGKLVGEILRRELGVTNDVISIDSIALQEFDFIDVGEIIQPTYVVPTVVKSLVFPVGVDQRAELVV